LESESKHNMDDIDAQTVGGGGVGRGVVRGKEGFKHRTHTHPRPPTGKFQKTLNKFAIKPNEGDPLAILSIKPGSRPGPPPPLFPGFWEKSELPRPLDFQPVCIYNG
jgi:hypothetical protein